MSITGTGTDIIGIERIAKLIDRYGERFINRCFRPAESQLAQKRGKSAAATLAGRWAAKEAFLKALGADVRQIPYRDIEVVRSNLGPVNFRLHGKALVAYEKVGAKKIHLSISHGRDQAIAFVIIEN